MALWYFSVEYFRRFVFMAYLVIVVVICRLTGNALYKATLLEVGEAMSTKWKTFALRIKRSPEKFKESIRTSNLNKAEYTARQSRSVGQRQ